MKLFIGKVISGFRDWITTVDFMNSSRIELRLHYMNDINK